MYLVDTSTWIDYFKNIKNSATIYFEQILDCNTPYGLTGIIYQEILQGAGSQKDFELLREYLNTQHFFSPLDIIDSHEAAAKLYYKCRKSGINIRSSIDCLIAQIAIENDLILLHNDQDYIRIQSMEKKLRLFEQKQLLVSSMS